LENLQVTIVLQPKNSQILSQLMDFGQQNSHLAQILTKNFVARRFAAPVFSRRAFWGAGWREGLPHNADYVVVLQKALVYGGFPHEKNT
jgi:hypothetical protein